MSAAEPAWLPALRSLLVAAVGVIHQPSPENAGRYRAAVRHAVDAGWVEPDDGYADLWRTAAVLAALGGTVRHVPGTAFLERETRRVTHRHGGEAGG